MTSPLVGVGLSGYLVLPYMEICLEGRSVLLGDKLGHGGVLNVLVFLFSSRSFTLVNSFAFLANSSVFVSSFLRSLSVSGSLCLATNSLGG